MNNNENYGTIYMIINSKNNKRYIGQTTNGFEGRYYKGDWVKYSKNKLLLEDVKQYGRNAFYVIEEFDTAFSKDELDSKEIFWIEFFDSYNIGYNKTKGGYKEPENYNEFKTIIKESDLYIEEKLKREYEDKLNSDCNKKCIKNTKLKDVFNLKKREERYTEMYHKLFLYSSIVNISLATLLALLLGKR